MTSNSATNQPEDRLDFFTAIRLLLRVHELTFSKLINRFVLRNKYQQKLILLARARASTGLVRTKVLGNWILTRMDGINSLYIRVLFELYETFYVTYCLLVDCHPLKYVQEYIYIYNVNYIRVNKYIYISQR